MLPKSKEAVYIASLSAPPPWFVHLIKSCAFLPPHITSPFVRQGESVAFTSYMGEPVEREKVYNIVRDFFTLDLMDMPLDVDLHDMDRDKLVDLRASIVSHIAAFQSLGPMMADLQARSVECLNGIGDQLECASVVLGKVDQHIATRPVEAPPPSSPSVWA